MTSSCMKTPEYESFSRWFGSYLLFAALATSGGVMAESFIQKGFEGALHYDRMGSYVTTIALPYILVNLLYSLTQFRMNLTNILLKVSVSCGLSLTLVALTSDVKPLFREDLDVVLYSLGAFTCIMLARDIVRNIPLALPGLVNRVLVVGNDGFMKEMENLIGGSNRHFQVAGTYPFPGPRPEPAASQVEDIFATAKALRADKVVISLAERRGVFPLQDMLNCKLSGIEVLDAPGIYERITGKLLLENINPSWFIFCSGFKITFVLRAVKRLVDIVCSVLGLLLSLPFAPFVLLAIRLDSPGPVFFRQERVGQGDKPFVLYKLRTMRQDAEQGTGAVWASQSDPRVTRLGQFLRKSRIDEIPQLINVLRGEMSLVGPRPERPEFVQKLKEIIPYYSERHFVKPGVTGWAQVRYPYGASVEDALEKLRYDLYYIKNISMFLDLSIILRTVAVVLLRKGAR
ncbi:exopolysaccharide biosynthesis polyprenyl glycosylphosphotransferase [Solidesulfovibrio carbinoliphilus subsp. oakridgensis]|uniref:Exopolysaccharide biosynthesis polyprenyl glycosylphosphotransferase n=2 Tax=Solidesulfovibrio carbinoliphilus TaxID=345370 RepID=G7QCF8_9BACT|nr:TIGR03013 family XrtA/PEP-CTERM system glycosyltransferase [Solidesulfovibrio carbinoliphilus]EHJ46114.1 exopolysaccharide biosynthesis polyprenyl glycosylphosphotransferase [Solidesulfovibrio carbinoliphilus subsp. oakridgensis]